MVWSPLSEVYCLANTANEACKTERALRSTSFKPFNEERAYDVYWRNKNALFRQLALAWLLHQPAVSSVIIGAAVHQFPR
jgi:aryl-alcohol dehydrogenase-like predicted oxidoreductase